MNIENPNRLLTYGEHIRAQESRENFDDIFRIIPTQGESHQLESIQKILLVLEEFGELNTNSIKLKTGLSWNGVNWAKNRLLEKNILIERTTQDKKNNEKFYSMNRNRAIIYINHIIFWKKIIPRYRLLGKKVKQVRKIERHYPLGFEDHVINVPIHERMKYKLNESKSKISDLPFQFVKKIMDGYIADKYCFGCFDDHNIVKTVRIKDDRFCPRCRTDEPEYYRTETFFTNEMSKKWTDY